jgi:hypothetical protein
MQPLIYQLPNIPMLGKGMILFDKFDANGLSTGFYPLGNCTKFELEPKDDTAELYDSINASSNLIATALKKRQIKLAITGTDFKTDVLSLVLLSAGKTVAATSVATVTGETLVSATATHAGRYHYTSKRNIDPATPPVVTNNAVVLVAGTDYFVSDLESGAIYFPPTTSAVDGHATTITYHTLVGSQDEIGAYVLPVLTGAIKFSPDPTDGQKLAVDVWKVNCSPSGQIGLIADDYGNWSLDGLVLGDFVNHPTQPFVRVAGLS